MPVNQTILNVFVASPSDVTDERNALANVIDELNLIFIDVYNCRLQLLRWEKDVHPSFGAYTQDVVNTQIGDEYDIFIGIFWGKIGTPTPQFDSGSIEEFERALSRLKLDASSIEIMMYFKDTPISPSKVDGSDLDKIKKLKQRLGEEGGAYTKFETTESFISLLRIHLSMVVKKITSSINSNNADNSAEANQLAVVADENDPLDEDYGYLDFIDIYDTKMNYLTECMGKMSDATIKVGDNIKKRTQQINDANNDVKLAKMAIKLSAEDINLYSHLMESEVEFHSNLIDDAFEALSKAVVIAIEFDKDDLTRFDSLYSELTSLKTSVFSANEGVGSFRAASSSLPKLTVELNKARRRTTAVLDKVLLENNRMIEYIDNILLIITEFKSSSTR
jgi:hypothetical protein